MKINVQMKKRESGKEKPELTADGYATAKIMGLSLKKSKFDNDIFVVELNANLVGEKGGEIPKKFFFDLLISKHNGLYSKLLRTMIKLEIITTSDANALIEKADAGEFEQADVKELLTKFKNHDQFKFKTELKNGKFHVNYDSIMNVDDSEYLMII